MQMISSKYKKDDGFTLIEIMIVISIIALLAVISIPSFLASRITANETSAIASTRVIYTGCQTYYMVQNPQSYPPTLESLAAPLANPPYIDDQLGVRKEKSGYTFSYQLGADGETFQLNVNPKTPNRTGNRYFFCNETGIITFKLGGMAGPNDPSVQ